MWLVQGHRRLGKAGKARGCLPKRQTDRVWNWWDGEGLQRGSSYRREKALHSVGCWEGGEEQKLLELPRQVQREEEAEVREHRCPFKTAGGQQKLV